MERKRPTRVAELLKQVLSEAIFRELRDPALHLVTITKVRISDDLKDAKVYFGIMGDEKAHAEALAGLNRAKSFLRGVIARKAGLRVVPSLIFFYDDTMDYVANIEQLLRKVRGQEN